MFVTTVKQNQTKITQQNYKEQTRKNTIFGTRKCSYILKKSLKKIETINNFHYHCVFLLLVEAISLMLLTKKRIWVFVTEHTPTAVAKPSVKNRTHLGGA
jgi:hypothetical protein